ncbi:MAG: T9SS type A sorting domain-containing protein [Bacteroidetes bacterium]|nr:MAG: T9SS type A sorting domain-containing protein [Bacteroidota bacterium]
MKSILFTWMKLLLLSSFMIPVPSAFSQCTGGSNGGNISPAPNANFQTMNVSDGTYYTFTASSSGCNTYDFSFCSNGGSAGFDTQLTILDNTGTTLSGNSYNDDACGTRSEILGWTPPADGVYRILVNTYSCASSGNTAVLAFRENGVRKSASGDYTLQSDATTASDPLCVQLTPDAGGQTGCAWDANSTLDFSQDFSYDFMVNLGDDDNGADGMTFIIQNDPAGICACGKDGQDFAAGGISNSLIIEIDTHLNTEDRDDGSDMSTAGVSCSGGPNVDHLDIWLNGNINPSGSSCPSSPGARVIPSASPLLDNGANYNIENGQNHVFRVSWDAASQTINASIMDLSLSKTYGRVSYSFDPTTIFGTTAPFFGFTAATGGLSNQQTFCNPPELLPIEITSFEVNCQDDRHFLQWEVASEQNNDYFTILRSTDGVHFKAIGKVQGAGNSSSLQRYSFQALSVPNATCYYTFSQTDFNGISKLSGFVRVLNCDSKKKVNIFPNPVQANQQVQIECNQSRNLTLHVFDTFGKLVLDRDLSEERTFFIELSAGLYQLVLYDLSGRIIQSERLVVTK